MKTKHVRHGDVLLVWVEALPASAKELTQGTKYTVAEGEFTGHAHVLSTRTKGGIRVFEHEGMRYLDLTGKARIKHQEHHELEVPAGLWRVDQEREFDYFTQEITRVQD